MKVVLAYVHPGEVRAEFMDSVCRVLTRGELEIVRVAARSGADITRARNAVFRMAAEQEPDYLWWVDTDMVFAPAVPEKLIEHHKDIVAAYCLGREAHAAFPAFQVFDAGAIRRGTFADVRQAGHRLIPVAGVGMACAMLSGNVVNTMASADNGPLWPYAEEVHPKYGVCEDDITFCVRAFEQGFHAFVDPATPVGHVKDAELWP